MTSILKCLSKVKFKVQDLHVSFLDVLQWAISKNTLRCGKNRQHRYPPHLGWVEPLGTKALSHHIPEVWQNPRVPHLPVRWLRENQTLPKTKQESRQKSQEVILKNDVMLAELALQLKKISFPWESWDTAARVTCEFHSLVLLMVWDECPSLGQSLYNTFPNLLHPLDTTRVSRSGCKLN